MDALYGKPYRVGIYTLLIELQTLGGARILHGKGMIAYLRGST